MREEIYIGRERDRENAEQYYIEKFAKRGVDPAMFPEESGLLEKIAEIYEREQGIQL